MAIIGIPDNTVMIRGVGYETPQSFFRRKNVGWFQPQQPITESPSTTEMALAALNSELIFIQDTVRAARGLPPLPRSNMQPSLNFGLTEDTRNVLLLGMAGFLTLYLFRRRRSRRRR